MSTKSSAAVLTVGIPTPPNATTNTSHESRVPGHRPYRTAVDDLRAWLAAKGWLVEPTTDDVDAAWAAYRAANAGAAGVVDHVSFVVMRRLGVTEAFTNDRHFQAAGFTTLFR